MGATNFMTTAKGKSLDDAFDAATDQARFYYGHGGYTGTIAEKETVMEVRTMRVPPGTRKTTYRHAVHLAVEWADIRQDTAEYLKNSLPRYIKMRKRIAKGVKELNAKGFDMVFFPFAVVIKLVAPIVLLLFICVKSCCVEPYVGHQFG